LLSCPNFAPDQAQFTPQNRQFVPYFCFCGHYRLPFPEVGHYEKQHTRPAYENRDRFGFVYPSGCGLHFCPRGRQPGPDRRPCGFATEAERSGPPANSGATGTDSGTSIGTVNGTVNDTGTGRHARDCGATSPHTRNGVILVHSRIAAWPPRGFTPFQAFSGGEHQLLLLMQQILAFPVSFVDTARASDKLRPALFRWNSPFEIESAIILN